MKFVPREKSVQQITLFDLKNRDQSTTFSFNEDPDNICMICSEPYYVILTGIHAGEIVDIDTSTKSGWKVTIRDKVYLAEN